jgi:hypothetical protein
MLKSTQALHLVNYQNLHHQHKGNLEESSARDIKRFYLISEEKRSITMSEQAATTNASPPKDENQNKDTPVSLDDQKSLLKSERRSEEKTFHRHSQHFAVIDNLCIGR